jgi:hypothetical protein
MRAYPLFPQSMTHRKKFVFAIYQRMAARAGMASGNSAK